MNENSPKVSIILPTYNGAKYIRQSIESCLNQTYKNIELIIVDDGSTNETYQIITSYKDKRIKYFRHNENKGLPYALNTGFSKGSGKYLTWTSDDNHYDEIAIEKMLSFLRDNNYSFVYCDYYTFEDNNLFNRNIIKLPDYTTLKNGNNIGPCFLYSRKVMKIIGDYDPVTELAEDYDYWIKVSKKFSMHHINEPLYFLRMHKESLTVSKRDEVRVVEFLVRLKNDILYIDDVTKLFTNYIAQNSWGLYKFNKILTKILFSKKIYIILRDFKLGKIDFENAKLKLKNIIERKLI